MVHIHEYTRALEKRGDEGRGGEEKGVEGRRRVRKRKRDTEREIAICSALEIQSIVSFQVQVSKNQKG